MNYIILFIIFIVLYFFKRNKNNSNIPGPISLPFFGSLLSMGKNDVHLLLQYWYNKYGPIYRVDMGYAISGVVLTEYPTIKKAFIENSEVFSPRFQPISRFILNDCSDIAVSNGTTHSILKRIVLSEMTNIRIKKQEMHIKNECIKLMSLLDQHAEDGKPFLMNNYISMFSLNIILRFTFGIDFPYQKVEETSEFISIIKEFIFTSGIPMLPDFLPILPHSNNASLFTSYKKLVKEIEKLIEKHNNRDDESILSKLLKEYEKGLITYDSVVSTCIILILGGTDTSSNSMMFCIIEMINNPIIQSKLFSDINTSSNNNIDQDEIAGEDMIILTHSKYRLLMPYLSLVIKEVYRKYPAAPFGIPHITLEDVIIDGYTIAKDSIVIQNIYATHRSDKYYTSPNEFIPERFIENNGNSNLVTFGIGERDCVGKKLAETEIFTMLASIFNRYEFLNPNPSKPLSEVGVTGLALQCHDAIVTIKKR